MLSAELRHALFHTHVGGVAQLPPRLVVLDSHLVGEQTQELPAAAAGYSSEFSNNAACTLDSNRVALHGRHGCSG